MLSAVLTYWKPVAYGLLTASLIIGVLTVMHWRQRAIDADVAEATVHKLIKDQIDADVARAKTEAEGKKTVEVIKWKTRDVIRRVKVVVHDNPGCDFTPDALRLLNDAKRLSPATGVPAPETGDVDHQPGSSDSPLYAD